jgi:hypothetical protein
MNNFLNRERIVLVVEDDPLIQEFEVATLKRAGFEVLSALNGIDGALFSRGISRKWMHWSRIFLCPGWMDSNSQRSREESARI